MTKQVVLIHVIGGIAHLVSKPEDVEVIIHDFDNAKASLEEGIDYQPEIYLAKEQK